MKKYIVVTAVVVGLIAVVVLVHGETKHKKLHENENGWMNKRALEWDHAEDDDNYLGDLDPIPAKALVDSNAASFLLCCLCVSKKHFLHNRTGSSPSSLGKTWQSRHPPKVLLTR